MRLVGSCLAALALCLGSAASACAQDVVKYNFDIHDVYGNPMRTPEDVTTLTPNGKRSLVRTQSINGNQVKQESVNEQVEQKDSRTRVIERTIQRYDPNGNPAGLERQRITEVKNDDGTLNTTTEKFHNDVNGNMSLAEKDETVERKTSPTTMESNTVLSRPTINGAFGVVEREEVVKNSSAQGKWAETKTVLRNGENGFYTANKVVTDHSEQGNRTVDNVAEYEIGSTGQLELHQQIAKQTVTTGEGSSVTSTDYFNRHAPGYAVTSDQQMVLRAREIEERKAEGSHRSVATLTVQQPSITDPTQLGAPKLVSEIVCTGACK